VFCDLNSPLVLVIIDGYGLSNKPLGNAIKSADTRNLDKIFSKYPFTKLSCSGESVGLPRGQMGNSEVGHTNLGAGRVVLQKFTKIQKSIKDKSFLKNKELLEVMNKVLKNNSTLHIMGIISDGGIHGHIDHLFAILDLAKSKNLTQIHIHAILDGRDSPPQSGKIFLKKCQDKIKELGIGKISSIIGRYYAMDRDNRWERTQKTYNAIANSDSQHFSDPIESIEESYKNGINDEFFVPRTHQSYRGINKNDFFIFSNFRPDRAKQITRAFCDRNFDNFKTNINILENFVAFTCYDPDISNLKVIFKNNNLKNTFGEYISLKNLSQLRIAETEKYAHVTFFFSGGINKKFKGEERILIDSPKIDTYDKKPEMSALEITRIVVEKIKKKSFDVVILNLANADMVGHTGNFEATIKAVEVVDKCILKIYEEIKKINGVLIITADHGNAEEMFDKNFNARTSHTINSVPFCVVGCPCKLKNFGALSNVAPTMLDILNFEKPEEMTSESLLLHNLKI
jgi:2,3-bisphosphoglycerate-independent phosphoglycerate mutase